MSLPDSAEEQLRKVGVVYGLTDVRTGEIRYVGKTVQKLKERVRCHLRATGSTHRACWIRSIGQENVGVVVLEVAPDSCLSDAEIAWISTLRRHGYRLTNHTDGGEGSSGWRPSPGVLAKRNASIRLALQREDVRAKAKASLQRYLSEPETRLRRSAATKLLWQNPDYAERVLSSQARTGYKHSPEARAKISLARTRPIVHGTISAYTNKKCRCEPCRAAQSEYNADYRARKLEEEHMLGVSGNS
jgi:hypothetical protein